MVDSDGIFVGLKLPWCERLPLGVQARLATLAKEWEGLVDHIPRGGRKSSVSVKFFGGGLKHDTDSGVAMHHTPRHFNYEKYLLNQGTIRNLLRSHVLSRVERYLYSLIDWPRDHLIGLGLGSSFISYFASISCGHLFFNEQHVDNDLYITILVALGECSLGGGFAYMGVGWVQELSAGDIAVVNPLKQHSTAEFGDPLCQRRMIAMFVGKNALIACATSAAVMRDKGLDGGRPPRRRRKR